MSLADALPRPFDTETVTLAGHAWTQRRGCNDHHIIDEVWGQDCYRMAAPLRPDSLVIDIGAHIGAFSVRALDRGAAHVWAFEPEPGNAALARQHVKPYGARAELYQLAVVRSDVDVTRQYVAPYPFMPWCGLFNTGGQSTLQPGGLPVDTIAFDEILRLAGDDITLVKIDAQGSEWPILLTSQELRRVRRLVGEFQELGGPGQGAIPPAMGAGLPTPLTGARLASHLQTLGFAVEIAMSPYDPLHTIGLFYADRQD
jgi:FkbM family methyltransferase